MPVGWFSSLSLCPFVGVRVGEATHPGPRPAETAAQITICCTNLGSILKKHDFITQLPATIVCLSETCATQRVQEQMSHTMRSSGMHITWGSPVEVKERAEQVVHFFGINAGVAVFSRMPSRPLWGAPPTSAVTAGRLCMSIVWTFC